MSEKQEGPFLGPFKGLSSAAASGSLEPGELNVCHNCYVDSDGSVVRRGGTAVVKEETTFRPIASRIVKTKFGREFILSVSDLGDVSIVPLSNFPDQTYTQFPPYTPYFNPVLADGEIVKSNILALPTNVFPNNAGIQNKINFEVIQEDVTTVLIFCGSCPVTQIRLDVVRADIQPIAVNGTSVIPTNPSQFPVDKYWASTVPGYFTIITDKERVLKPVSMSAAFNWTTTPSTQVVTNPVEIYHVSWQWWAEAYQWNGYNFRQSKTRLNAIPTDQIVAVPPELVVDVDPIVGKSQQTVLYVTNAAFAANNTMASVPTSTPVTAYEYGLSTGVRYIPATGQQLNPTYNFITFGGLEAGAAVTQLYFTAFRPVRFNNGAGYVPNDTDIFVNDETTTITLTANPGDTYRSFVALNLTVAGGVTNWAVPAGLGNVATHVYQSMFDGTLPFDAVVRIINKRHPRAAFVTGEQATWFKTATNVDGCYVPIPGIGFSSDYQNGNFHINGSLFGNRLVLVNPVGSVDQLSVSATLDEFGTGVPYSFFQVTNALTGLATDPFYVNVTKDRGEITAIKQWENNLFIFFNDVTYAVSVSGSFSATTYSTFLVSNYGAWNQNAVIVTNLSILFYNKFGVFDLLSKNTDEKYAAAERSRPIREEIERREVNLLSTYNWMSYDSVIDSVYVNQLLDIRNVTTASETKMYVLNMVNNTWSTYTIGQRNILKMPTQSSRHFTFLWHGNQLLILNQAMLLDFQQIATVGKLTLGPIIQRIAYGHQESIYSLPTHPQVPGLKQVSGPTAAGTLTNVYTSPAFNIEYLDDRFRIPGQSGLNVFLTPWDTVYYSEDILPVVSQPNPNYFCNAIAYNSGTWEYIPVWPGNSSSLSAAVLTAFYSGVLLTTGANGAPATVVSGTTIGLPFVSVVRSSITNFQSLGRYKRLKRLHTLFDTRVDDDAKSADVAIKYFRSALVVVHSNYGDSNQRTSLDTTGWSNSTISVQSGWSVAQSRYQHTQPLQGYGCDYSFSVVSIGPHPFKLVGYEWDVVANEKRYVQGDAQSWGR